IAPSGADPTDDKSSEVTSASAAPPREVESQPAASPAEPLGALASRLRTLSEPKRPRATSDIPPDAPAAVAPIEAEQTPLPPDEAPFAPVIGETNGASAPTSDGAEIAFHSYDAPDVHEVEPKDPAFLAPRDLRDPALEQSANDVRPSDMLQSNNATNDPLHEPFSPHRTGVDEAEIVIRRDGQADPLVAPMPDLKQRDSGFLDRISRMFYRKD
ncbi:MAG: hypothetical protein AAGJ70_14465, partial [Pseudomonadota bacterium]